MKNRVSPLTAPGKLTNPRSPHALLRSYSDPSPRSSRVGGSLIRSVTLTIFVSLFGMGLFTAAPALAAAPEKPVTVSPAKEIESASAKFEGTLNPHSTTKVGGYFAYSNPGGPLCTEGPTVGLEEFEGEKEEEAISVHATAGLNRSGRIASVSLRPTKRANRNRAMKWSSRPLPLRRKLTARPLLW